MPAPTTTEELIDLIRKSGLLEEKQLDSYIEPRRAAADLPGEPKELVRAMLRDGLLTTFQSEQLLAGKARGFNIAGKYRLLEHVGAGGMGSVFLCEHISMRRRVAIKILPFAKAKDASYLERFYREARAVAALDHPNIVRAHDIDHDGKLHFLVMEYVDGSSLQDIVSKHGPIEWQRAAHYLSQAAWGLQHAFEGGLVHRDIKPGNILVDRTGTVKVLDLGLARFFNDDDNLSKKYDETVLGTSDYLAPEQSLDSNVDTRADIYSLGATFYYCLTGQTIFGEGTAAQKLIWHQTRQPKPIRTHRPEVPEELAVIIEKKMLAKDPAQRFQTPVEIVDALAAWTQTPIPPPPEQEMPRFCPAVQRVSQTESSLIQAGAAVSRDDAPTTPSRRGRAATGASSRLGYSALSTRAGGNRGVETAKPSPNRTPPLNAEIGSLEESNGRPEQKTAIQEAPPEPRPASKKSLAPASRRHRPVATPGWTRKQVLLAAAVLTLIATAGTGGAIWWAASRLSSKTKEDTAAQAATTPTAQGAPKPAPTTTPVAPKVSDVRKVKTPRYEATVEKDGCLTSLRVGGVELLYKGGKVARGVYFHQSPGPGTLKLPSIEQPADNLITAKSDLASIRYSFGSDTLTWDVANTSKASMNFFIVFLPVVAAVTNDKGEWAKTPVTRDWGTTTWFGGSAKLTITGSTNIWGPFEGNYQVWAATLKPGEKRQVVVKVGATSDAEAGKVALATGAVQPDLAVTSPLNYQVFQRYSRHRGQALLQGKVKPACNKLEVRITGASLDGKLPDKWEPLPLNEEDRSFETIQPLPAGGWYKVEIRALLSDRVVAETVIDKVGIGEVFVMSGQSNSTNCGEERLKPATGMVSSFSGTRWQVGDDPQPGVHDRTGGGSPWPAFGDALYEKYKVPIGMASTGHTGSSINQWQPPGSDYYKWLTKRLQQFGSGGFRAVLWHQGESDVQMSADQYAKLLTNVIQASKKDAGWDFPWFVAQVSYHHPEQASFPTTRAAQKKLWDTGLALEGPDTDTLTGDLRDAGGKGIHFSGKGLRAHGKLWAEKVGVYLDKALAQ